MTHHTVQDHACRKPATAFCPTSATSQRVTLHLHSAVLSKHTTTRPLLPLHVIQYVCSAANNSPCSSMIFSTIRDMHACVFGPTCFACAICVGKSLTNHPKCIQGSHPPSATYAMFLRNTFVCTFLTMHLLNARVIQLWFDTPFSENACPQSRYANGSNRKCSACHVNGTPIANFFFASECYYVPSASLLQMPKILGSVWPCRGRTLVMIVPVQRCSCSRAHRAAFPSDHCKLLLYRLVRHQSYAGCFRGGAYVPCLRRQGRGRGWLAFWVGQSIFACQKKMHPSIPAKKTSLPGNYACLVPDIQHDVPGHRSPLTSQRCQRLTVAPHTLQ